MNDSNVFLKEIDWPEFGTAQPVAEPAVAEIESRIDQCRRRMEDAGLTHLVVYGDREHFANLMYLTHFDPRFEEAILVINRREHPLLLVGNECVGHLPVSPLYRAGKLRYERYQPLSLLNQPRNESRPLETIFLSEGMGKASKAGCAGWKYFSDAEFPDHPTRMEIPSYIVDTLRAICGYQSVTNATGIFMSPANGLRTTCSAYEIAAFEFANVMASEGIKNLLKHFRAGATDFELMQELRYTGYPLNCHTGIKSSGNLHYGLSSPVGAPVRLGDPCSMNIGYWGSNICRAGWVAAGENDLPEQARGYIEHFAAPYFKACREWFRKMKIGTRGKELQKTIDDHLPFNEFGVFLNPGHLIHTDEWVSSPVYKDSDDTIRSGMYLQADIIPRSSRYFSTRMEDGIAVADSGLRSELEALYPDVYKRCMLRRKFMIEELGFELPDEILPLSNIPAIIAPYFLDYRKVLSFKP